MNQLFSKECQDLFATLQFPISSPVRCLHVEGGWEDLIAHKILAASNHESSALRELSIGPPGNRSLVYSLTNYPTLLNRLTSFSANYFQVPIDVFASMRRLSYFSQTSFLLTLPQASSVFNMLQEAQFLLVTVRVLDTHEFGKLRKLVLRNCGIPATIQPGAIKVPVLDTLIFEGRTWLPILVFDCPSVSHLELEGGVKSKSEAKREVDRIWGPGERFSHLRILKIYKVMSDTVLIAILKGSVALEHLYITVPDEVHRGAPGDTFFNSLLVKNPRRSPFLQSLRTLVLVLTTEAELSSVLRDGMQRVVHSRQQSAPLWIATLQVQEWTLDGISISNEEFVV
jgi:hypothetical protein